MIATHLSDEELAGVVSGHIPADRFEHLMMHLDDCEECQQRASTSETHDSFAGVLASGAKETHDPILAEADCQAAIFHAAASPAMRMDRVLPPIETLGPYRLIRPLGRGGMGAVYLAEHGRLRKQVAIKLLPRQFGFDATWIGRFEREMQAVANLSHPGIVTATDAGDVDGWHYLVMEYLDGLDLAAIIGRIESIDVDIAASVMGDVCDALASVHEAGLVHRDIKPSNIMLTRDGAVKLLDLGLVLDQQASITDLRLTTVGHVIGTLAFAAPEQLSDRSVVDARADLYAVGVTLFQLVTGRTPHSTQHGIAPLVIEKTSEPAPSLRSLAPDAPALLNELVSELLERDPADRPARAEDVARRLDALATDGKIKSLVARATRIPGEPSFSEPSLRLSIAPPPVPPRGRGWKWLAAAGIPIGLLVLATVITIQMGKRTVRIETDDPEIKVAIGDFDRTSPLVAVQEDPQKLFKGKTLEEWTAIVLTDRDVDTLSDAMTAMASLVDVDDLIATQSILVAARRYGGWVERWSENDAGNSTEQFMRTLIQIVEPRIMPQPGIDAITTELVEGNEKSRCAALWLLWRFSQGKTPPSPLHRWASEPGNRALATKLHHNLKGSLRRDELTIEESQSWAKHLSLVLALALHAPLEEEPDLRNDIERIVAAAQSSISVEERINQRIATAYDPVKMPPMTPQQFVAANRLGIDLPASLVAAVTLSLSSDLQSERHKICKEKLHSAPQKTADALLLPLNWSFLHTAGYHNKLEGQILGNSSFWVDALPIVTENTTRPDYLTYWISTVIEHSIGDEKGRMRTHNDLPTDWSKPSDAMAEALKASIKRARERMEAESLPEVHPASPGQNSGGMF